MPNIFLLDYIIILSRTHSVITEGPHPHPKGEAPRTPNARATLDKQSCVITPTFVYHDYWLFVKAGHTTFLKTKRLLVKPQCKQRSHCDANKPI